jgi:hypothetical protein
MAAEPTHAAGGPTWNLARPATRAVGAAIVATYAALGAILVWSRTVRLEAPYCCDELVTVGRYVRGGPGEIFTGSYVPNNHELFSLLGWASSSLVGESEVLLRLGSAIPFVVGALLFTVWLHVRVGPLSGVLFLFLATFSPLLLDLSRQARGYGLAFLAMSVLVIGALEAERSGRALAVAAFCVGGMLGTLTLPHFAVAFLTTGAVLLTNERLRRATALGLAASALAIAVWYAPHVDDIVRSSGQSYGVPIPTAWLLSSPVDQTLVPALSLNDDSFFEPNLGSLLVAVALVVLIASSPLLRTARSALVTVAGSVATVLVFWASGTDVAPRFFSFLLVPLFGVLASGCAAILTRRPRPPIGRTLVAVGALAYLLAASLPLMIAVAHVPRDRMGDAAAVVAERAGPTTPVVAYVPYPYDLEFHLGRPVRWATTPAQAERVCKETSAAVFVAQPWLWPVFEPPCTSRAGAEHVHFEQYGRGGRTDVWIIPPAG